MHKQLSFVFATLALSTVAFAQNPITADSPYQVSYAANLNVGDSRVILSNSGANGGFIPNTLGAANLCINVYTFDPAEEEIACCSCLVTPNGLNAISDTADLISNPLTPAIPTSIIIKLVSSVPAAAPVTGTFTVCNPATVTGASLRPGMLAWGSTLEPAAFPGTYNTINAPFIPSTLVGGGAAGGGTELAALTSICSFIQADGSGYGICKSCQTGALAGKK